MTFLQCSSLTGMFRNIGENWIFVLVCLSVTFIYLFIYAIMDRLANISICYLKALHEMRRMRGKIKDGKRICNNNFEKWRTVKFIKIKNVCLFWLLISLIAAEYNVLIWIYWRMPGHGRCPTAMSPMLLEPLKVGAETRWICVRGGVRTRVLSHHRPRHCLCAIASPFFSFTSSFLPFPEFLMNSLPQDCTEAIL